MEMDRISVICKKHDQEERRISVNNVGRGIAVVVSNILEPKKNKRKCNQNHHLINFLFVELIKTEQKLIRHCQILN